MKQLFLLIIIFFSGHSFAEPLLVLSLMIKNEEHVIRPTLEPFLKGGVKHFLIYDTGSTDKTIEVTRSLFREYRLSDSQAVIIEEPFVDFGTSRSRALDLVDKKFPQAIFTLMIDAEWFIHDVPGLMTFCNQYRYDTQAVYLLRITDYITNFYTARLIRTNAHARFIGVVHEQLDIPASIKLPDAIYFEYNPGQRGREQSHARWERDKNLLLNYLKKHPNDARTAFYLAQTYGALGDFYNSYTYYEIRVKLEGFDEETFLAHHRMGMISEHLSKTDPTFTWSMALNHYMNAFAYRPHRIEPLISLAMHYWNEKNIPVCFMFARRAAEIPFPPDYFCVEQYMYDVLRYDLLGVCAASVGEFDIGEWAVRMALKATPQDERLKKNLAEYQRLKKLQEEQRSLPVQHQNMAEYNIFVPAQTTSVPSHTPYLVKPTV